jgi:hypothetical protein
MNLCYVSTVNKHGYLAVNEDFLGFATQQQTGNTAPTMRSHEDQVAAMPLCGVDNRLIRKLADV